MTVVTDPPAIGLLLNELARDSGGLPVTLDADRLNDALTNTGLTLLDTDLDSTHGKLTDLLRPYLVDRDHFQVGAGPDGGYAVWELADNGRGRFDYRAVDGHDNYLTVSDAAAAVPAIVARRVLEALT